MDKNKNNKSAITQVITILGLFTLLILKLFTKRKVGYTSKKILDEIVMIAKGE